MPPDEDVRELLGTLGSAGIGVLLGVGVLGVGFLVSSATVRDTSRTALYAASTATAPIAARAVTASEATATPSSMPAASLVPAPTVAPSPPPTPEPTTAPTPAPTPDPLLVTDYRNGGRRYAALRGPVGHTYVAPFEGTVDVSVYQFIDGQVRVGSNVPSVPFFPYVSISSPDRKLVLRPGPLNVDTQLLIEDGARVEAGTPLFKTIGDGPSSWHTFYDGGVTAQVIASLTTSGGADLDPLALFGG